MTISFVDGDILDGDWDILVQSVNHKGVMGAGLAKQIASAWPKIVPSYKTFCNETIFKEIKSRGLFHCFPVSGEYFPSYIISIFGQNDYGRDSRHTDYISLGNGLLSVADFAARNRHGKIAIPYGIGCGLGGGDWNIVYPIIQDVFNDYPELDVKIYKYEQ